MVCISIVFFNFPSQEKILDDYRHIITERINPQLPKYFKNIPDVPLEYVL